MIGIKNFRLLKDAELSLENNTTVIVGRNNSGKTSLTELFRRLLSDTSPHFPLEDFSLCTHEGFWDAFLSFTMDEGEDAIRDKLPTIEIKIHIEYDRNAQDLGILSDFIIDLDPNSAEVILVIKYELKDGLIPSFFDKITLPNDQDLKEQKITFLKSLKDRIPQFYNLTLMTVDPTDNSNYQTMELSKLRALLQVGFINAQRGLDDSTYKEKDVLGKVLSKILDTARSETASTTERNNVQALEDAVKGIQNKLDNDFNEQLNKLIPALAIFGYPGLNDPQLGTETVLDVQKLLENHTKLRYSSENGIGLPETYNGLGSRNLIFILLHLYEFFKSFKAKQTAPYVHLVFIEEPEAHMHPQMMEVFIRKLKEIADKFASDFNDGQPWPVQFVVTSHSTHIANEADFESIRYFLCSQNEQQYTHIKDLRLGLNGDSFKDDREFLHKYLTLTRCDLFFADKAILIEGPTERILMPEMIKKIDTLIDNGKKLSSQYLSVIEVGGAYAHHFFKLLEFLELRTLIITDIDAVKKTDEKNNKGPYIACRVSEGSRTSNSCIKKWFNKPDISPSDLIAKTTEQKVREYQRIAFQIPERNTKSCGRSFEDAFVLANQKMFNINGKTEKEIEDFAWKEAQNVDKKTDFALKYAVDEKEWNVPEYIKDGLIWLAEDNIKDEHPATTTEDEAKEAIMNEASDEI